MFDWIASVLTSEFVWGTILGVALSVVTARVALYFQEQQQRQRVGKFAADLIRNIRDYVDALEENRERSKVIFIDIIALIENELQIWGRNREHLILISDDVARKSVRDYFAKCAKLVVDIRYRIDQFTQLMAASAAANEPENGPNRSKAAEHLREAHGSCDRLVAHVRSRVAIEELTVRR